MMAMAVRRLTPLTNAFSKKWENHREALAFYFAYYTFLHDPRHVEDDARNGGVHHVPQMDAGGIDGCVNDFGLYTNTTSPTRPKTKMTELEFGTKFDCQC
jgi:hypothetical protein